jgi:hypothetical protein
MRRAPRNWTYWVSLFTLLNGVFLSMGQDVLILAGLVAPFLVGHAWPHFAAAAFYASLAYFSASSRFPLVVALVLYVADALLTVYLELWSGLIMHLVVLALVGVALAGARLLSRQLAPAAQASDG